MFIIFIEQGSIFKIYNVFLSNICIIYNFIAFLIPKYNTILALL